MSLLLTQGYEGFNVDDEEDWERAERSSQAAGRRSLRSRDRRMLAHMDGRKPETLFCDAGWRPWIFLKATADDGSIGWAEITHAGRPGLAGIVDDLPHSSSAATSRPVEAVYWDLYRARARAPAP